MKEEWRAVIGFEGYYEVSSLGRIKTVARTYTRKNGKILPIRSRIRKQVISSPGYPCVTLRREMKSWLKRVHRLVAMAFIPNPERKPQVNHKDRTRTNNRLDNLEWATNGENVRHGYTFPDRKRTRLRGEKSPMAKLTEQAVMFLRSVYIPRDRHFGATAMAREMNLDKTTVSKAISGENWNWIGKP